MSVSRLETTRSGKTSGLSDVMTRSKPVTDLSECDVWVAALLPQFLPKPLVDSVARVPAEAGQQVGQ